VHKRAKRWKKRESVVWWKAWGSWAAALSAAAAGGRANESLSTYLALLFNQHTCL